MQPLSIYFHWPFCRSKCPYCDFNVHINDAIQSPEFQNRWLSAYLKALDHYAARMPDRIIGSIYFGGGTPSLMNPELVEAIIAKVREHWPCANDVEITIEANPNASEFEKFEAFKMVGVNRLSLGVQALNNKDLSFLGRSHDLDGALKAIELANNTFDRFSFDLIYARPHQTLKDWEAELDQAIHLANGHLSLYQLTIERNTPFYLRHQRGEFFLPEEGLAADFFSLTQDKLAAAGLPAYEVSNHAAEGHQSIHNRTYWNYGEYIGIGPGAHGRIFQGDQRFATRDHYAPDRWLQWCEEKGHGAHPFEKIEPEDQAIEALMMGLRLYEGINLSDIVQKTGVQSEFIEVQKLDELASQGWLCYENEHISLQREGMLRLNAILPYILKE